MLDEMKCRTLCRIGLLRRSPFSRKAVEITGDAGWVSCEENRFSELSGQFQGRAEFIGVFLAFGIQRVQKLQDLWWDRCLSYE